MIGYSRAAIVHKEGRRVTLCHRQDNVVTLVISVMFCDYITIEVSYKGDRWLIKGYHNDNSEIGFMFADYIQKGDY